MEERKKISSKHLILQGWSFPEAVVKLEQIRRVHLACGCIDFFCGGCIYSEILDLTTIFNIFGGCICTP